MPPRERRTPRCSLARAHRLYARQRQFDVLPPLEPGEGVGYDSGLLEPQDGVVAFGDPDGAGRLRDDEFGGRGHGDDCATRRDEGDERQQDWCGEATPHGFLPGEEHGQRYRYLSS